MKCGVGAMVDSDWRLGMVLEEVVSFVNYVCHALNQGLQQNIKFTTRVKYSIQRASHKLSDDADARGNSGWYEEGKAWDADAGAG